jgi:hypothetical protein
MLHWDENEKKIAFYSTRTENSTLSKYLYKNKLCNNMTDIEIIDLTTGILQIRVFADTKMS